jgi:hypothetical protein
MAAPQATMDTPPRTVTGGYYGQQMVIFLLNEKKPGIDQIRG